MAQDGASVAIFDRNLSSAEAVAADIVAAGGVAAAFEVDVADRAAIDAGVAATRERFGAATILVNNAGITPFARFLEIDRESYERVMAVNLRGPFDMCQAVLPDMIAARWGRIVNISSSSAQTGNAGQVHYASSKAGVIGLTRSLAKEFGSKGVTVNAIPPSFVETPSLHDAAARGQIGAGIEQHVPATPVRRVGQPEDIAAACAYLARDDASYVTGQVLGVNGGRVIG